MFLLDTNVVSEVRKAHRCNAGVARWFAGVSDADLFVSVVVIPKPKKRKPHRVAPACSFRGTD